MFDIVSVFIEWALIRIIMIYNIENSVSLLENLEKERNGRTGTD